MLFAAPARACSIIWGGYERITAQSDALIVVEVTAASGLRSAAGENPLNPTAEGRAQGRVEWQLRGSRLPRETGFDDWTFDPETSCGIDFDAEVGGAYYVWLKRRPDGDLHTWFGQSADEISDSQRNLIASHARR